MMHIFDPSGQQKITSGFSIGIHHIVCMQQLQETNFINNNDQLEFMLMSIQ